MDYRGAHNSLEDNVANVNGAPTVWQAKEV